MTDLQSVNNYVPSVYKYHLVPNDDFIQPEISLQVWTVAVAVSKPVIQNYR